MSNNDKAREYTIQLNKARLRAAQNLCRQEQERPRQIREESPPRNDRLEQLHTMPYAKYLKTPEWQAKRQKALRFAGFHCQVCNSSDRLEVHHRTYERRGHELLGDLVTLCNDCHMIFHANRELS